MDVNGNVYVVDTLIGAALGHGNDTVEVIETVDASQPADGIGRELEQRSAFRESFAATLTKLNEPWSYTVSITSTVSFPCPSAAPIRVSITSTFPTTFTFPFTSTFSTDDWV